MSYRRGCFGVLNLEDMDSPLYLCDGGIELRQQEKYDFYNDRRPDFSGYLFQYTLGGQGYFQKAGKPMFLQPEWVFSHLFPKTADIFCRTQHPANVPFHPKTVLPFGNFYIFTLTVRQSSPLHTDLTHSATVSFLSLRTVCPSACYFSFRNA